MKSDLLSVLKSLTTDENRKFDLFLKDNYLSRNKNTYVFFKELHKHYPLYIIDQEMKHSIYKAIYKSDNFNDSTYRSLVRTLMLSLEDYLLVEDSMNINASRELRLIKLFNERNVQDVVSKKLEDFERTIKSNNVGDLSKYYLKLYEYEIIKFNFIDTNNNILHKDEADDTFKYIINANHRITLYYFIEIVSNYVNLKIQQNMYNEHNEDLEMIITEKDIKKYDQMFDNTDYEFAYLIYKQLFILFSNKASKKHFLSYKQSVISNAHRLSKKEMLQHYHLMGSFCIQNKAVIPELNDELWMLYELLLTKELYLAGENKYLETYLFRSIILLGLKLGNIARVKEIIGKYASKTHPDDIDNMANLGYAYYQYYIGNYEKSLDYANKIELNDFVFKYDLKNLLVKVYFEAGAFEQLNSVIRCYKEFLRNDKLQNETIKESFRQFLYYTEQLVKRIESKDKLDLNFIYTKLQISNKVYAKEWLVKMYTSVLSKKESESYA